MRLSVFLKRQMKHIKITERVEKELLSTLLDYIVPHVNSRINFQNQTLHPGLENFISKPKFDQSDFSHLESLLFSHSEKNVKISKRIRTNSFDVSHEIEMSRKKTETEISSAVESISITYEENSRSEKLRVTLRKSGKDYSGEIVKEKEKESDIIPYKLTVYYAQNYERERLSISYFQQLSGYLKEHIKSKEDMASRVPLKWLNILPENIMGGVLGFTYLGENFMGRRADLTGKTARMVDIHESIHTPDEYETRVLTSWIMEKARGKYLR